MARKRKISIKEHTEIITNKVREVLESKRFKEFLKSPDVLLAFRQEVLGQEPYSFNNRLTLGLFGASAVAGFRTWLKLGYHVKKGSKGIPIFRPLITKQEKENEEQDQSPTEETKLYGFDVAYVFDISQVEKSKGEESKERRRNVVQFFKNREKQTHFCRELQGGDEWLKDNLLQWVNLKMPVKIENIMGNGKGSTDGRKIVVKTGMAASQVIKTVLHELAHVRLGHIGSPYLTREAQEVQAESAAYIASHILGLNTSPYSFDYLASWGHRILGNEDGMKEFKEVIMKALEEGKKMATEYEAFAGAYLPVAV